MENKEIFTALPGALLPWYRANRRELPWRRDRDPYHIWVSEIMLQQTRVEAVKGYYSRFLDQLPTLRDLACATDEQLHKLWEGLGYYSRIRNMKKAAQIVMQRHNGVFPTDYTEVLALPGIGAYTAGAVCSIAFGQATPAVDGNVLRVITRLTNDFTPIDNPAFKKRISGSLGEIYPAEAGEFTQALMELGATVCGPNRKPDCGCCPCRDFCVAHNKGTAERLPVKNPKQQRRIEDKTVLILSCDGFYALEKRANEGLLAGLWQFPNLAEKLEMDDVLCRLEQYGLHVGDIYKTVERKHIFTHVQWHMRGVYAEVRNMTAQFQWMTERQIQQEIALPTAFRLFWDAR